MGKIIQFPPPEEQEVKNPDPPCPDQPNGETCEPGDQIEQDGDKDTSKPGLFELMSEMPGCISNKILAQIISAAGFLIAGFVILFAFKMKQSVLLVVMAGWLAWNAILTVSDYRHGKIIEESVICVSATPEKMRKTIRVVMRTADEENPTFYEYRVPGRRAEDFIPNKVYITYVKEYSPHTLFAYQEL